MRISLLLGVLLAVTAAGCSDSDDEEATASPDTTTVASASPTAASYVSQVNALCEALIPGVMGIRGDKDGDGGGDLPAMEEFEDQQLKIAPITAAFDAEVDAIPVSEADRAAADAFDDYREFTDADTAKIITAAQSGDEQEYQEALELSAEFETKRAALAAEGISCPAR